MKDHSLSHLESQQKETQGFLGTLSLYVTGAGACCEGPRSIRDGDGDHPPFLVAGVLLGFQTLRLQLLNRSLAMNVPVPGGSLLLGYFLISHKQAVFHSLSPKAVISVKDR